MQGAIEKNRIFILIEIKVLIRQVFYLLKAWIARAKEKSTNTFQFVFEKREQVRLWPINAG